MSKISTLKTNISSFLRNAGRVLRMTKRPDKEEYWTVAKITGLGVVLLGIIGYLFLTIKIIFPLG